MVVSNGDTSLHYEYFDDQSDEDDDITSMDLGITIVEDLDDQKLWASFGKALEDFTMRDVRKLTFKFLNLCCEFYKLYAKSKGFGIQEKTACKSRTDGHLTSKIFKCSAKGLRLQKYLNNPNRKRKLK